MGTRTLAHVGAGVAIALAAAGCSSVLDDVGGGSCPEGFVQRTKTGEVVGGLQTREEAIRAGLDEIGMEASDQAVADAIVHAVAPPNTLDENLTVRTTDGIDVMLTLTPLDPGWAVRGFSWCEPS